MPYLRLERRTALNLVPDPTYNEAATAKGLFVATNAPAKPAFRLAGVFVGSRVRLNIRGIHNLPGKRIRA